MTRPPARWRRREPQPPDPDTIDALALALVDQDADRTRSLLHATVVTVIDSGGYGDAPSSALPGPDAAADAVLRSAVSGDVATASVNGSPGIVIRQLGRITTVLCARTHAGLIVELWIIRNPEKLRRWDRP
ncbi:sigma-70 family RNA polymerase sigma factor family protein [Microbacterium saperdae]